MGTAPYVIAIISAWAVVATILAVRHRHGRLRERQGHADARELVQRHRAALSRLKHQAAALGAEMDALRQRHEPFEEHPAHALAPPGALDVDREVGHEAVSLARAVGVQAAPRHHRGTRRAAVGVGLRHHDGVARTARRQPLSPLVRRP